VQGGTLQKNTTLAPAGQRPWTPKAGESAVTDWYDQGNRLHLEENRPLDAERAYRRAIEEAPTDARPWNGLGILLSDRLGRVDEAAAAFERAIALDPGFAAPWNGLGIHQQEQLCRPELAHDSFLKAIESDPLDFTPWCNLAGLLRLWRSDGAGATRAYKLALEIAPGRTRRRHWPERWRRSPTPRPGRWRPRWCWPVTPWRSARPHWPNTGATGHSTC
jgi:tetratricopeptide (TPR) repeat protein